MSSYKKGEVSLQTTFYPTADTWFDGYFAENNYGARTTLECDQAALVRFDVSSIPAGTQISAAQLRITKTVSPRSSYAPTFYVYSVSNANSGWIEGTKNATRAGAGEPCLEALEADGAGGVTTAWDSGGNFNAATDTENVTLASKAINRADDANTTYHLDFNNDGLTRIEGWFGSPNTNYGICLKWALDLRFASRENATEDYRPMLTLTYS